MGIIYEDKVPGKFEESMKFLNPNKMWLKHFANSIILTKIQQNPKDLSERFQATKELGICEKKMKYWENRSGFSMEQAANESKKIRSMWKEGGKNV